MVMMVVQHQNHNLDHIKMLKMVHQKYIVASIVVLLHIKVMVLTAKADRDTSVKIVVAHGQKIMEIV